MYTTNIFSEFPYKVSKASLGVPRSNVKTTKHYFYFLNTHSQCSGHFSSHFILKTAVFNIINYLALKTNLHIYCKDILNLYIILYTYSLVTLLSRTFSMSAMHLLLLY